MYFGRKRLPSWAQLAVAVLTGASTLVAHAARAQVIAARVGVLRATSEQVPSQLADGVDAALLRDLSVLAGIDDPIVSPVDYAEVQLSVGCADESAQCLAAIARAVRVDALIVRKLTVDAQGAGQLELSYFAAASDDAPATVRARATSAEMQVQLVAAVSALVRELFGIPEIVEAASAPPPTTRHDDAHTSSDAGGSDLLLPGVIALGAGAAVLTAGIVVGVSAQRDFDVWKKQVVGTPAEADASNVAFAELETRAIVAAVLIPVGALSLALGATLLLLDIGADDGAAPPAEVAIAPFYDGEALHVRASFERAF